MGLLIPALCLALHVYQTSRIMPLEDAVRTRTFWILPAALLVILVLGLFLPFGATLLLCIAFMAGYPQIAAFVERR